MAALALHYEVKRDTFLMKSYNLTMTLLINSARTGKMIEASKNSCRYKFGSGINLKGNAKMLVKK